MTYLLQDQCVVANFDGVAGPGTRFMYATLQAEDHYAIL